MQRSVQLSWIVLLLLVSIGSARAAETDPAAVDRRIAELIEQLGSPRYLTRERAEKELAQLGFAAFDALTEAENHADLEIAAKARYLVRQIQVQWFDEDDPAEVKEILKDYESQIEQGRQSRIGQLGQLSGNGGVEALCRLARFEQSPVLSKLAALTIIKQEAPKDETLRSQRAEMIVKALDRSRRPAAEWLRAYLRAEKDPAGALDDWKQLVAAEAQSISERPLQSQNSQVIDLLRIEVDLLDRIGRSDEALDTMRKMVQFLEPEGEDQQSLIDVVEWLAQRKAWSVIDEVATKFTANFESDAMLMYMLASARVAQGNDKLAAETADKALKISGDSGPEHATVAKELQDRGLFEWSDQEFRRAIEIGPPNSVSTLWAQMYYSESLHDRQLDLEAAEVRKALVDTMDSDKTGGATRAVQQRLLSTVEAMRSRMYYFYACHYAQIKDHAKEAEYLKKGIEQDPTDGDVLIGLYRLPNQTPEERAETLELIKKAADEYRQMIEDAPEDSTAYNQLAWLIGNTEGDFDEAIRLSHKSIDLRRAECARLGIPCRVGGYLDTLGHCYFAKKDYENAVKYQSEAVAQDRHSQQIARKLAVFRQALEEQKAAAQ